MFVERNIRIKQAGTYPHPKVPPCVSVGVLFTFAINPAGLICIVVRQDHSALFAVLPLDRFPHLVALLRDLDMCAVHRAMTVRALLGCALHG
jgi:hypothetical protein